MGVYSSVTQRSTPVLDVRSSYHADRMAAAAGYATLDTLKKAQRSLPHPA